MQNCNELCHKVHGHDRAGEVVDAIHEGTAVVVERNGSLTGYATDLGFFGHAVGETNLDIQALIGQCAINSPDREFWCRPATHPCSAGAWRMACESPSR